MAKRFLTDINLTGNQIIQASLEKLASDPVADLFEGRMYYNTAVDKIKYYNGTAWVVIGEAGDIALGTNTSGNYVADLTAGTGISVSGGGVETANITVTNTGVTGISGTANEVTVSASTGSVTVGLPDSVQITSDLTVGGNLTVNGTTTTLNTTELLVEDNLITLNSGVTGTPSLNAGIEIERGTSANVALRWNETSDTWELTRDGTNYEEITTVGTVTSSDISDFAEAAQDAVGAMIADTATVDLTYTDGTPELKADVKLATTSYLSGTSGLAVDIASVETKLVTDGFTKKVAANVGNGTNTSFTVNHNLGTRDVHVQIFDNTTYDTVEADVVRTDTNNVTVSFATAPTSNAYRVLVIG